MEVHIQPGCIDAVMQAAEACPVSVISVSE